MASSKKTTLAKGSGLNAAQERFVAEYLIDLNASQAVIRAGYTGKNANVIGPRLLAHVGVARAVAEGKAKQLRSADLSAAKVLRELQRCAFPDIVAILQCETVDDVARLSEDTKAALVGFEVVQANISKIRDGKLETVRRAKVVDKLKALELLAKHFKLLTEVGNAGEVAEELLARLDRGRERNHDRKNR